MKRRCVLATRLGILEATVQPENAADGSQLKSGPGILATCRAACFPALQVSRFSRPCPLRRSATQSLLKPFSAQSTELPNLPAVAATSPARRHRDRGASCRRAAQTGFPRRRALRAADRRRTSTRRRPLDNPPGQFLDSALFVAPAARSLGQSGAMPAGTQVARDGHAGLHLTSESYGS